MHYYQNPVYLQELKTLVDQIENREKLKNKTFVISGATGMLGSLITDLLLYGNGNYGWNCKVAALVRNPEKARKRFADVREENGLQLVQADLGVELSPEIAGQIECADFVIHLASNTHPKQYATDPVNTVLSNIIGTNSLLKLTAALKAERFALLSSVEVYGENRGDTEKFREDYCGYIDCGTLRAGYPEGKRAAEALCHAYAAQHGVDFVTVRLARAYGPTLQRSDTKAMSQFLWNALAGEPIVLKSEGTQQYSYIYAGDAVRGILWLLTEGKSREAYNLSGKDSDVRLRDLAGTIAELAGTEVIFDLPDAVEAAGYSKATKAMLDDTKIRTTGYEPVYDIKTGLNRTMKILGEVLE